MPVLQAIPYDLELSKLALPKEPKVQRIQVADYSDAEGKDALRITVVLANDTTDEQLRGENVWSLKSAIRDELLPKSEGRFPYIFLTTEADLSAPAVEEE